MSGVRNLLLGTAVLCAAFLSPARAADTPPQSVDFPSLDRRADGTPVALNALWWKSALPGRQPSVVVLHGCGGMYSTRPGHENALNARQQAMGELLHREGYNVLIVDSFNPRGTRSICTSAYRSRDIRPANRRLDALAALRWIGTQPEADAARTALLGWSNGGSSTLDTMNRAHDDDAAAAVGIPAFKAAVAFYPGCAAYLYRPYRLESPLLVLVGASDDWTPAAPCVSWEQKLQPAPLTVRVYPDSYHDFDSPNTPLRVRKDVPNGVHPGQGVTVGSNPAAREAAYQEMVGFLAARLK